MAQMREPQTYPRNPTGTGGARRPGREPRRDGDVPRIVDEQPVTDQWGEPGRVAVDEHGRRFWQVRPAERGRYDVFGFGWFWWTILWAIVIGLVVWGWGWGWGT